MSAQKHMWRFLLRCSPKALHFTALFLADLYNVYMSSYTLKLLVIGFSFTDMSTAAEDGSGARPRVAVSLQATIPAGRSHPPLPPYAMCCIDQSVLEDAQFIAPSVTRRNTRSMIPQIMGDFDGLSGMGPSPPPGDSSAHPPGPVPRTASLYSGSWSC